MTLLKILSGGSNKSLAKHLALDLRANYSEPSITYFRDTEIKIEILQSTDHEECELVDYIIVQSTSKPVNDHLIELLLLIDIAKRAGAKQIIVVMPYFGYARQDRVISKNISVPARLLAKLLETAGATSIITIDLHSTRIEEFFKIPIYNLDPTDLYLPFLKNYSNFVIVAPDQGSILRAGKAANLLGMDMEVVFLTKQRDINNSCEIVEIHGNVKNKTCVLIDDIIDGGRTICKAAKFLIDLGALSVDAFITHPVLSAEAQENIDYSLINNIYITDTINVNNLPARFHIIPVASIIVESLKKYYVPSSVHT